MWVRLREEIYDLSKCTSILVDKDGCTLRFGHPSEKLALTFGGEGKRDPQVTAFYEAVKAYTERLCPMPAPKSNVRAEILAEPVDQSAHFPKTILACLKDDCSLRRKAVFCAASAIAEIRRWNFRALDCPSVKQIYESALQVSTPQGITEEEFISVVEGLALDSRPRESMLLILAQCIQVITEIDEYALR